MTAGNLRVDSQVLLSLSAAVEFYLNGLLPRLKELIVPKQNAVA
jgi:hypothetical protein